MISRVSILLILLPFLVFSQDQDKDTKHQEIVLSVIKLIYQYETSSNYDGGNMDYQFSNLFIDSEVQIPNDILTLGRFNDKLSIIEYIEKMEEDIEIAEVAIHIKSISAIEFISDRKGTIEASITKVVAQKNYVMREEGEGYYINVIDACYYLKFNNGNEFYAYNDTKTNDKEIAECYEKKEEAKQFAKKYNSSHSNKLSVKKLFGESYKEYINYVDTLNMIIRFSFDTTSIRITDISLEKKKDNLIVVSPHIGTVLDFFKTNKQGNSTENFNLEINSRPDTVYDYFYNIPNVSDGDEISIKAADHNLLGSRKISMKSLKNPESRLVEIRFNRPIAYFSYNHSWSLSPVKINANNYNASLGDNSSLKNTLSFIFKIKQFNDKFSLLGKLGYTIENMSYTININELSQSYAYVDDDEESYIRTVSLYNIEETQNLELNTAFWQAGVNININDRMSLTLSGGMIFKIYLNEPKYKSSADAQYSGYYDDLFGITIAENGVYDFGYFPNLKDEGELLINQDIQAVIGDFTFNYKLMDIGYCRVKVFAGLNYIHYQSNIIDPGNEKISHSAYKENNGNNHVLNSVNNLINYDMNHWSLSTGLIIEF